MKVTYNNEQDELDPLDGCVIGTSGELANFLEDARIKTPFFARLSCDNGFELLVGIGANVGCAQYSRSYGESPNLMAVSRCPSMKRGYIEFLAADTPTPVAARYIISFEELKEVILHFFQTGDRSDAVVWQRLNLRALKEDAERPAEP